MFTLTGIEAGYGTGPVLRGIDLEVPDGQVVALIGPNGAGKTTLLRVASGLLSATAGQMHIDRDDVTGCPPRDLVARGVCHVPEGRGIFPPLTVRDNITLFAKRGRERQAVERAVHAFPRLGERLHQVAGTMSGGEQQMLALSRAYVQSPRLVLLDEVSMGLAPVIVDEIFEFFGTLVAEGASLLIVEQYVSRVLEVADYVYLINGGEVVVEGSPAALAATDIFAAYVGAEYMEVAP